LPLNGAGFRMPISFRSDDQARTEGMLFQWAAPVVLLQFDQSTKNGDPAGDAGGHKPDTGPMD